MYHLSVSSNNLIGGRDKIARLLFTFHVDLIKLSNPKIIQRQVISAIAEI